MISYPQIMTIQYLNKRETKMTATSIMKRDFKQNIKVAELKSGSRTFELVMSDSDLAELAERFGLNAIRSLTAIVEIQDKGPRQGVLLKGKIKADLDQHCVVSNDPVPSNIDTDLYLRLVGPEELERLDEAEAFLDPEADEYDALEGDEINLGEVVAQTVSMSLDQFPRKESADIKIKPNQDVTFNEELLEKKNPFSALEKLRDKT